MDNELDGRLRRLETVLDGQRTLLEAHGARVEQTYVLVRELLSLIERPEPAGPSLHVLIGQLIEVIGHTNTLVERGHATSTKTLEAIERMDRRGGV